MRYVLVRVVEGALILLAVSAIAFFIPAMNTQPDSIVVSLLGNSHGLTRGEFQYLLQSFGLNQPVLERYWDWLVGAIQGNFGIAYAESTVFHRVTVDQVISGDVGRSLWLIVPPTIAAFLVAVPVGLLQAMRRNKPSDHAVTTLTFVLFSIPTFVVAFLLAYYIGVKVLGVATVSPVARGVPPSEFGSYVINHFKELLLPYVALFLLAVGGLTRFMRGTAVRETNQQYIRTAKAKGAGPWRVAFHHLLRPSVIPLIPIVGLTIPVIISGAIIVEDVFNFPGMGEQLRASVESGDSTVVTALIVLATLIVVVLNLVLHVCTALLDPRVRRSAAR